MSRSTVWRMLVVVAIVIGMTIASGVALIAFVKSLGWV